MTTDPEREAVRRQLARYTGDDVEDFEILQYDAAVGTRSMHIATGTIGGRRYAIGLHDPAMVDDEPVVRFLLARVANRQASP